MLFRGRQSSDNRGYTLQTVIVMAILVAAAVGASVVLYRAINSNTDVRSLTDTAGTNAPSRPHNLVVEKTLETVGSRTVSSATVRWSPPLYTGFTRFEEQPGEGEQPVDATPASLLYRAEYGCAAPNGDISELADITLENIPDSTPDPTDMASTTDIDESKLDTDGPQTYFGESAELSLPARILGELFPVSMPPETVYCILRATAYTCPDAQTQPCANPGDNESRTNDPLSGDEIYSLESELIRFELSRTPTKTQNPEAVVSYFYVLDTATPPNRVHHNRVDVTWDAPEYTGIGDALIYEIRWKQRKTNEDETNFGPAPPRDPALPPLPPPNPFDPRFFRQCTLSNTHTIELPLDVNPLSTLARHAGSELAVDIRITPYAVTETVAVQAVPTNSPTPFHCDFMQELDTDNYIELPDILLTPAIPISLNNQESATNPSSSEINLRFDSIPAADAAKRTALNDSSIDVKVRWRVDADEEESVDSYDLTWSRADGIGSAGLVKIEKSGDPKVFPYLPTSATPPNPAMTLEADLDLENDKAYNFVLTKNFVDGEAVSVSLCSIVSHPQRTPAPEVEIVPRSTELIVRIAFPDQERFCNSEALALSAPLTILSAPTTEHYKVRVYDPTSVCASPGNYPDRQCASDAHNDCLMVTTVAPIPSAEEVIVMGLTASTTYEVEVIAGHTCNTTAKTIGFTIPSPNPDERGFPSAPVVMQATTTAAVTLPAAPTNVSATFLPSDAAVNYDRWRLSWDEVIDATSYLFTIHHDTAMTDNARRYAHTPSSREASFAARAPVAAFTCNSGSTLTCTVPDDDPSSSAPHTNLKFEVWSVSNAGISATSAMQTTAEP